MDPAKAFEIVVGLLLTIIATLSSWTLRTVLRMQARLDVMETRYDVVLHGSDGQNGLVGDIRYLRNRVGWIGRAAHALRDRCFTIERHVKLEGLPHLELPPE